jgi:hypothetical protein
MVPVTAVYASVLIYCTHFVRSQGISDKMWISIKQCTIQFTKLNLSGLFQQKLMTKHAAFDSTLFPNFSGISSDFKWILNERLCDTVTAFFTTYVTDILKRNSSNLGRTHQLHTLNEHALYCVPPPPIKHCGCTSKLKSVCKCFLHILSSQHTTHTVMGSCIVVKQRKYKEPMNPVLNGSDDGTLKLGLFGLRTLSIT